MVIVPKPRGAFLRFLSQFNNVLIYVLVGAGIVTAALQHWIDSGVIFGVVLVNAVIGFIQAVLVSAATVWGFQVRLAGSFTLLLGLTMLFVLSTLGLGLLVGGPGGPETRFLEADVADVLRHNWSFRGRYSEVRGRRHGRDASHVDPSRFVVFGQNHDQVGNRRDGDRLDRTRLAFCLSLT